MNWLHLLEAAKLLAGQTGAPAPPGRPRQAMIKRAVSTAYYAMFHALYHSNANALIGASTGPSHPPAWTGTYRALEHNFARERMRQHRASIPSAVQNFGVAFRVLQENRHIADYDPDARLLRSDVVKRSPPSSCCATDNLPQPRLRQHQPNPGHRVATRRSLAIGNQEPSGPASRPSSSAVSDMFR